MDQLSIPSTTRSLVASFDPMTSRRPIFLLALLACHVAQLAVPQEGRGQAAGPSKDQRCLNCHGQKHIATISQEERRTMVALEPGEQMPERENLGTLLLDRDLVRASVHRDVACTECHRDSEKLPHAPRLQDAVCEDCHTEAAAEVRRSRHAEVALKSDPPAPRCWDCHGTHDIRLKSDRSSSVYPLQVIKTCGSCHKKHAGTMGGFEGGEALVESYLDDVHAQRSARADPAIAATCADCHGHHDVLPSYDPRSRVYRANIPGTCGECHEDVQGVFETSVHADARRQGDLGARAPVCIDCHAAHRITRSQTPEFLEDIAGECGSCHEALYRTYLEGYHGQVAERRRAARCSDCHGGHGIRRIDDPQSALSAANRAATCARCHDGLKDLPESRRANFVAYRPHADFRDAEHEPRLFYSRFLSLVVIALAFVLWGLHSLAWLSRGSRMRDGPSPAGAGPRFGIVRSWSSLLLLGSILCLAVTGLSLKLRGEPLGAELLGSVGGAATAVWLHRVLAVSLGVGVLLHAVHLWYERRGPGGNERRFGLLPGRRDWRQLSEMLRWFTGRGVMPRLARWSYWEKSHYWVALAGIALVGASGLVLWFPASVAENLSGFWLNVAVVLHGYGALLLVALLVTALLFHLVLRLRHGGRWERLPAGDGNLSRQAAEGESPGKPAAASGRAVSTAGQAGSTARRRWRKKVALATLVLGLAFDALIIWAALN